MNGFGLDHLPYGVFSVAGGPRRVGVRYDDAEGAWVVDLHGETGRPEFAEPSLNPLMALGPEVWRQTREEVRALIEGGCEPLPLEEVTLHLPVEVADYVDFYASLDHATNVGKIFRPDSEPLTPNWRHLPIGYHGRAGTVVVSGTPVTRPSGQRKAPDEAAPTYGPRRRLDIEAELGFVVGAPSELGRPGAVHRPGRPRLRRHRAQRLVGARHPGVGVRPARAVPRQVVRDLDLAVGHPAGRPRRRLGRPSRAGAASRSPTSARAPPAASTSTWRSSSTARWSAGRRTARCTGRPPRCSPT